MKTPLISVIMPVYNMELYIGEAIDSIINQTFSDFELIIIDDSSTDNSWNKIKSYNDNRIISIRNKTNMGNYPARNIGIKIAKGKYVAVMDADDIAMPDRLHKQFTHMEKDKDLVALGSRFIPSTKNEIIEIPLFYQEIQISLLGAFVFLHPSLMVKTGTIKEIGGYNENYRYAADYDLLCKLIFIGKVEFLPDALMIHRIHPTQISSSHSLEQNKYAINIRKNYQMLFINKYRGREQKDIKPVGGINSLLRCLKISCTYY